MSKDKLRLALSVISGRMPVFNSADYALLGYEVSEYLDEDLTVYELREKCEEIVLDAIVNSSLCLPIFNEKKE